MPMVAVCHGSIRAPARCDFTTPLTDRAEAVNVCGDEDPEIADSRIRSPSMLMSMEKSAPAVVHNPPAPVVTDRDVSVVLIDPGTAEGE